MLDTGRSGEAKEKEDYELVEQSLEMPFFSIHAKCKGTGTAEVTFAWLVLVGWWVGVGGLVGWCWLVGWLVGWLFGWSVGRSVGRLVGWLVGYFSIYCV